MLKKIAYSVVAVVGALLLYAATKPDTFHVQRSINIQAPPEKIFAVLNDFHQSVSWSPYEKKDPAMKRAFSGPESGKGAVYSFEGNKEVGKGQLTITETIPSSKIVRPWISRSRSRGTISSSTPWMPRAVRPMSRGRCMDNNPTLGK